MRPLRCPCPAEISDFGSRMCCRPASDCRAESGNPLCHPDRGSIATERTDLWSVRGASTTAPQIPRLASLVRDDKKGATLSPPTPKNRMHSIPSPSPAENSGFGIPPARAEISDFGFRISDFLPPTHVCPQITQIQTRAFCDVICVNLRDLRFLRVGRVGRLKTRRRGTSR